MHDSLPGLEDNCLTALTSSSENEITETGRNRTVR